MLGRRIALAGLALALLLPALSGSAAAHERQDILDGTHQLVVGWRTEPPFAGERNGLDLGVNKKLADNKTEPVAVPLGDLTVTYEYGGRTFAPVDFRGQFGQTGRYTGEITPTREGEYVVRVVGRIDGKAFDARVHVHEVGALTTTMFPEPDLTSEEASSSIAALEKQLADLKAEVASMKAASRSVDATPTPVEAPDAIPAVALLAALGVVLAVALLRRT